MEAAIEAEGVQILIYSQKRFLVNVIGVFGRPQQIEGQPEDTLVVQAH